MPEFFKGWSITDKRLVLNLNPRYVQGEQVLKQAGAEIHVLDATGRTPEQVEKDNELIHRVNEEELEFLKEYHRLQAEADVANESGDTEQEIAAYKQMADMAPWDAIAVMLIGVALAVEGRYSEALKFLHQAAEIDGENPRVQENLHNISAAAALAGVAVGAKAVEASPKAPPLSTKCAACKKDLTAAALGTQEAMAAKMFGISTSGYRCDRCGDTICTACYASAAAAQGATGLTHGDCGGTFREADAETPPAEPVGAEDDIDIPTRPLDTKALSELAARRRWQCDDLAEDRRQGSRCCDQCETQVQTSAGYLVEPAKAGRPDTPPAMTDDVQKLSDQLKRVWDQLGFSTAHCDRCGITLPKRRGDVSDMMDMNFLVKFQNTSPQALGGAVKLCEAYFGGDEKMADPAAPNFAKACILNFVGLGTCGQCESRLCGRCEQLPHAEDGCVICTEASTSGPRIVCESCFGKQDVESPKLRALCALWAGRPDLAPEAGSEHIPLLVESLDATETDIAKVARQALCQLSDPTAIDAFCSRWADSRESQLRDILGECRYVASQPGNVQFFTSLLAKQTTELEAGGVEVVEPLLAAAQNEDEAIAESAKNVLSRLSNPELQDAICRLANDQRFPMARQIALEAGYVPSDEKERVLYFYLTRQWHAYKKADPDRSRFQEVFAGANVSLRKQLQDIAGEDNRLEWVQAVIGGPKCQRVSQMFDAEWTTMIAIMERREQWESMWSLVRRVPVRWAIEMISRLAKSNWNPIGTDQSLFNSLVNASTSWSEPGPVELSSRIIAVTSDADQTRILDRQKPCFLSPDGRFMAVMGNLIDPSKVYLSVRSIDSRSSCVKRMSEGNFQIFSDNGELIVTANKFKKTIQIWRTKDGQCLRTYGAAQSDFVHSCAISEDGGLLVSSDHAKTVRLWSPKHSQPVGTIKCEDVINRVVISGDKRLIAGSGCDGIMRLWSSKTGAMFWKVDCENYVGQSFVFSPNSRLLATGGSGSTVRVWDLRRKALVHTLERHHRGGCQSNVRVNCVAFRSDGRLLSSGGSDGFVNLWDVQDGKLLARFKVRCAGAAGVKQIVFGADGRHLICRTVASPIMSPADLFQVTSWGLLPVDVAILSNRPINRLTEQDVAIIKEGLDRTETSNEELALLEFLLLAARSLHIAAD